jgi:hypothetical protein
MLYWFVHGISANIIAIRFNVAASLCGSNIVVDALIFKDTLFNWFFPYIFHGLCFLKIMDKFFKACCLLNVCGPNNGSYIPLSQNPNKRAIIGMHIIIIDREIAIQLFYKQIVTWTSCLECMLFGS